ncbi:hypothetical protein [Litorimonas cladophorae]|uniref:hypothetical protein n=1 Tax=Litorimonas cladophorae TaxID=1220491 RepID=UPI001677EF6E|nr:hypothetical protein [Litorimonas cladophorae]
MRYPPDKRIAWLSRKTKQQIWYSIAEANSADRPNLVGHRISADPNVETKVSTAAVSGDACETHVRQSIDAILSDG